MKVPFEFFDVDFENICDLSKEDLANRIIEFANKLKTESNDVVNLQHIQNIVDHMASEVSEELL